jgi:dihydrofolate reductase
LVGYQSQRVLSAATRNNHPIGAPTVVVTHNAPQDTTKWLHPTFVNGVSEGIADARESPTKDVTIASADITRQALDLGLAYEVCVSLVPVLPGRGMPYFTNLTSAPHHFDDPVVLQGKCVTQLRHRVRH